MASSVFYIFEVAMYDNQSSPAMVDAGLAITSPGYTPTNNVISLWTEQAT